MEEFKYLIPEESIDAIITNVEKLREIENHLRHVFSNHGYNEVLMPSFEYVDLYTKLDCGFTVKHAIVILEKCIVKKQCIKEEAVSFFKVV